ncbi:hypothetical protein FBY40_0233 [Microbacterium sp. SLBN-154]|nr:hypothetical protein FBY40_0233 [Microbacterium sp. SLBN-154]
MVVRMAGVVITSLVTLHRGEVVEARYAGASSAGRSDDSHKAR